LQAEKTGRFSLHWRDNTRPDKRSASGNLGFGISQNQRNHSGLTPNRAESALMWDIVRDHCPDKI
ncbi:hypothetical protein, partial [Escherichia coli]|uniref:hypothetical protein n=1 Tax=Escherichia coli TaxID=562 RepID=UPI001BC84F4B